MGKTTNTILSLCVIYFSVLVSGSKHLVPSQKIDDRLQKMFTVLNPSFSQGVKNLNKLFDLVMNNKEIDEVKTQIQETIKSAESFFKDVEQKSAKQLKQYQNDIDSLTDDISNNERKLKNYQVQLENLSKERTEWSERAENLLIKIEEVGVAIRRANEEIRRVEGQLNAKRKKNRRLWTVFTIMTLGVGAFGLVYNEKIIQKLQDSRNSYESSVREHRQIFHQTKKSLHNITVNHKCTYDFVNIEESRILEGQSMLKEMKEYHPALISLGVEIKTIQTFLADVSSKVNVMNEKNEVLVVLKPLLFHLDKIVKLSLRVS